MPSARLLFLADTHLGFDLPFRPRVDRRRRGPDFFANFERALLPALRGEVDLVLHGGDLFYRSKVPPVLIEMALAPLLKVAERGVPVYIVPGNHERSRLPLHLLTTHENMHIFDRPRTYLCQLPAGTLALSGFPFFRQVGVRFPYLVCSSGYQDVRADARFLCIHQAVEGAKVGVSNYTFRSGADVIQGQGIPAGFSAVLSGHIHRAQRLSHDLQGRSLPAPVFYPGSTERTSFAEREEDKGYLLLTIQLSGQDRGVLAEASFNPLPTRPMVSLTLDPEAPDVSVLLDLVSRRLRPLDPDAVVRVQMRGPHSRWACDTLSAAVLRELAPRTMNITLAIDRAAFERNRRDPSRVPL